MPITAWTPVPRTAAEMPALRSPSPIRRMRAPVARISSMSFLVAVAFENHDNEVFLVAIEAPRDGADVIGDGSV